MRTAIVFGLLVAATPAIGAYFDGNALNELCRSDRTSATYYVLGAADQMAGLCVPAAVQLTQVTDVVCNFVSDHPEARQIPAGQMTRDAVNVAWPC